MDFNRCSHIKIGSKNNEELEELMESLKRNIIVMDDDSGTQHSYGIVVMSDANMQTKRAQLYYEQLRHDERILLSLLDILRRGVLQKKF